MQLNEQRVGGHDGLAQSPLQWFAEHLRSTAEGFTWAVAQVPRARLDATPPPGLGEWTVTRHIFHLVFYEEAIAVPSMQQWLCGPRPDEEQIDEEAAWVANAASLEGLLDQFQQVRAQQAALLAALAAVDWHSTCDTVWGAKPLVWVVSKTYQHTAEHISDVLRIALFWDFFASRQA